MKSNPAEQLPPHERVVSPQVLAGLLNTAAEGMLRTGGGQRLGSYVMGYENHAGIKQNPVRGRVTHARLFTTPAASGPVVSHELHLPSKDSPAGNYEPGKVIFETHRHDHSGKRVGTERQVLGQVDMAGPEIQPYLEQIDGLKHKQ